MDSRRSLLVLALIFISFLVYQQWQLDKNPQMPTEQTYQCFKRGLKANIRDTRERFTDARSVPCNFPQGDSKYFSSPN